MIGKYPKFPFNFGQAYLIMTQQLSGKRDWCTDETR